ncbi:MAG: hypothetical protein IJ399_04275 [Bacilli bacterium]|nr:hypothetical protein [Bacilli bacterium]
MENEKEKLEKIRDTVKEFMEYLESHGLELDSNGDIVPKNYNKELSLELKDEE